MEIGLDFYRDFFNKLSTTSATYNSADYTIIIYPQNITEITSLLDQYGIESDIIQQNNLAIVIDSFPCKLFWNDDIFLKRNNDISIFNNDILILNYDNEEPAKFYFKKNTYINFTLDEENYFFKNSRSYLKFLDILSDEDKKQDDVFHFIDDYSRANGKAVFTSIKDFGKLILRFSSGILKLDEKENYEIKVNSFSECFLQENKHLPKFLKNEFFVFLAKEKELDRIKILFDKFDEIIISAKLNFEVYLNDLSLESLKKDYNDYKQKYFNQLNDFLNNFTNKIIALPLTISAVLIGIIKSTESSISLVMLILALIITSLYLFSILRINMEDINNLEQTFDRDYKQFSTSSFFIKFPDEELYFKKVKHRIKEKIKKLRTFIKIFYWITAISNFALIIYSFSFIFSLTSSAIIMISIIFLSFIAFTYQYYIVSENYDD